MDELVEEFLTETNEGLDELDLDLVKLEQDPNDKDLLGKIFRLIHTIKGTCGFLGLPRLEKVAHHGENVLGRFRDGDLAVTPEYVSLIFESLDRIKYIVSEIENTGAEPDGDDTELIAKLDEVFESDASGAPAAEEKPAVDGTPAASDEDPDIVSEDALEAAFRNAEVKSPEEIKADLEAELKTKEEEAIKKANAEAQALQAAKKENNTGTAEVAKKAVSAQTLRVNVDVLENLMTMVSELVLTRNQLLQILRTQSDSEFSTPLQRLNQIVSELQEGVMKTRMQPIGKAWAKLPRIIRDLSLELGKKIELEMRGEETELDRQVLELIKDPLTHMVRNSGDHGIESPEQRLAAGKPEQGTIVLEAFHEGGHIIIQISDDGKGLSTDVIKRKAIENGLATEEELADMPLPQIQQFIFKAGFSTAEKVTSVSGRGVGMDVVRTNIEKIGGSIELKSTEGRGSTFTIKIPLTLAIVSALIVEAGGERFAIPQLSVKELVMASEHGDNKIETIKGTPVFRLRDHLLPLISLSDMLKLHSPDLDGAADEIREEYAGQESILSMKAQLETLLKQHGENVVEAQGEEDTAQTSAEDNIVKLDTSKRSKAKGEDNTYIVVTQVGSYEFGIIVDRVFDTEEIVVKPVASILRDIDLFSGNTILGDGSVIMILDPNGIAKEAGDIETPEHADSREEEERARDRRHGEKISLLIFSTGDNIPKAVPLSLVARLENIKTDTIENSNNQMMVQYRNQLMPLVKFDNSIDIPEKGEIPVLVFADGDKSLGIIVHDIVDIIEERIDVQIAGNGPGLMGSAIINGKATDVVDVMHFLNGHNRNWFKDHGDEPFEKDGQNGRAGKRKVLLIDDSPFFRNMLTPLLSIAGYEVTSMESAEEALKMCEGGSHFDVIVSDIEMPDMNGFQFAEALRSHPEWNDTPLVALSSHATPQDMDRGTEAGFNKYVAKFDRDTLLTTLSQTLSDAKS